ncbi:hypothetical protein DFH27DRAFT_521681 [Peziza echinospora]|nr:hypothetical protein DFH27DRAFT_521681 [Peziza echinospora]
MAGLSYKQMEETPKIPHTLVDDQFHGDPFPGQFVGPHAKEIFQLLINIAESEENGKNVPLAVALTELRKYPRLQCALKINDRPFMDIVFKGILMLRDGDTDKFEKYGQETRRLGETDRGVMKQLDGNECVLSGWGDIVGGTTQLAHILPHAHTARVRSYLCDYWQAIFVLLGHKGVELWEAFGGRRVNHRGNIITLSPNMHDGFDKGNYKIELGITALDMLNDEGLIVGVVDTQSIIHPENKEAHDLTLATLISQHKTLPCQVSHNNGLQVFQTTHILSLTRTEQFQRIPQHENTYCSMRYMLEDPETHARRPACITYGGNIPYTRNGEFELPDSC